jgi:hypothetical protein
VCSTNLNTIVHAALRNHIIYVSKRTHVCTHARTRLRTHAEKKVVQILRSLEKKATTGPEGRDRKRSRTQLPEYTVGGRRTRWATRYKAKLFLNYELTFIPH